MKNDAGRVAGGKAGMAEAVVRTQHDLVGSPQSNAQCETAEVWASRNPLGLVVPYKTCARIERDLAKALVLAERYIVASINGDRMQKWNEDIDLVWVISTSNTTRHRGEPTNQGENHGNQP